MKFLSSFHRCQSWSWGWPRPPIFWAGGSWVVAGVVDGSWNIIISYHVQELCSKVVTFQAK